MHKCYMAEILKRHGNPLRLLAVHARVADEELRHAPAPVLSFVVTIHKVEESRRQPTDTVWFFMKRGTERGALMDPRIEFEDDDKGRNTRMTREEVRGRGV